MDYSQLLDRPAAICGDNIYCHEKELIGIGESLHAMGGMGTMLRTYRDIAARVPVRLGYQHEVTPVKPDDPGFSPNMISSAWNNVGDWQR